LLRKPATPKKRQLIPIKTLGSPKTGNVSVVVVTSGKTVRVEGLGVETG
jgi:hypothetical protein